MEKEAWEKASWYVTHSLGWCCSSKAILACQTPLES